MSPSAGPSRRRRRLVGAMLATCSVLLGTGCSTTLQGHAVSVFDDPFRVAGMPATDGPTGLRANAEGPTREVEGTDGGDIDQLAGSAISDIEQFWETTYPDAFDDDFVPAKALVSWDAGGFDGEFCGDDTYGLVNAGYCFPDRTIGWDRGELLPSLQRARGDMGVVMVLAHEYGHAVARQAGLSRRGHADPGRRAAGRLPLRRLYALGGRGQLTALLAEHRRGPQQCVGRCRLVPGSAAQRGRSRRRRPTNTARHSNGCRRSSSASPTDHRHARASTCARSTSGAATCRCSCLRTRPASSPVTEDSVRSIVDAMGILFSPAAPPALSFDTADAENCADARPSPPASFCPATNTIVVDLAGLQELGAQPDRRGRHQPGHGRQHGLFGAGVAVHASDPAAARRRGARQRRGRAAHRVPYRGGDREDDQGSHHTRRRTPSR